jgi:hypothetical protein
VLTFAVWCYSIQAGILPSVKSQKVTVHIDKDLLRKAQQQTGKGVSATIRHGLELVAASQTYDRLRALRGKVSFSIDVKALREDRS